MPTYEFRCDLCGQMTEEVRPMSEARSERHCSFCGSVAHRTYSAQVGIVDGPSLAAVDAPEWPVDHNDPQRRRIVPNRHEWKERIKRSEGRLEDLS